MAGIFVAFTAFAHRERRFELGQPPRLCLLSAMICKEELPVVSSWDSCTLAIIITIFSSSTVLLRWYLTSLLRDGGMLLAPQRVLIIATATNHRRAERERRWTDPLVLLCLLQQVCPCFYSRVQREQELNHYFFCSRSWVPADLLNTKMKSHTVSLEWKQHEVSVERVEQNVKGNKTERREQLTPGAEQICLFCLTVWVLFLAQFSVFILWVSKHISTALGWKMKQLQGGCSFFLKQALQPVGNES